jgi:hypothetical protein
MIVLTASRAAAARSSKSMARNSKSRSSPLHVLIKGQIPQAYLVASRWLVFPTLELEGKYSSIRRLHSRYHGNDVEVERGERNADEISGGRTFLSQSIVRSRRLRT